MVNSPKGRRLVLIALWSCRHDDRHHVWISIDETGMMTHPQPIFTTLISFYKWMCQRTAVHWSMWCMFMWVFCVCKAVGVCLYMNTTGQLTRLSSSLADSWIMQTLLKVSTTQTYKLWTFDGIIQKGFPFMNCLVVCGQANWYWKQWQLCCKSRKIYSQLEFSDSIFIV